jgi:hypothetical protein
MPRSPEELRLDQRTPCGFALTAEFAQRVRNAANTLSPELTFHELYWRDKKAGQEWFDFIGRLSGLEKGALTRALGSLSWKAGEKGKHITIGEIRIEPPSKRWVFSSTYSQRKMGQVTADFLTLAFGQNQSENEITP